MFFRYSPPVEKNTASTPFFLFIIDNNILALKYRIVNSNSLIFSYYYVFRNKYKCYFRYGGEIMSVDFNLIGQRIQERRKKVNKTQENLAEYLDVSVGYVSLMERGKTKISLSTLARIADFLKCNIGYLVDNSSKNNTAYLNNEINDKIQKLNDNEKEMLYKLIDFYIKNRQN